MVAGPVAANKNENRNAAGTGGPPSTSQLTPLERQAERTIHPKQSDPGFEYAGSSLSCPSPPKVFLPVLNKSQESPHQEVYHSSHPEVNDKPLKKTLGNIIKYFRNHINFGFRRECHIGSGAPIRINHCLLLSPISLDEFDSRHCPIGGRR
ncbi:UNVERIFIED_CONTAM: hypothetical protein FKN15_069168 [Acipenser sinensis]